MLLNKNILFIGAGPEMEPGIKWAKEMGLTVIATDMNPNAIGFRYADYSEVVSTKDIEKTMQIARIYHNKIGLHGVMTLASDVPLTVASVAEELSLPGISVSAAQCLQNKLLMKRKLLNKGIPIPNFENVSSISQAKEACSKLGLPVIIKPLDNSGARGVNIVFNKNEIVNAFTYAMANNIESNEVLVEEFLEGPQISTESIIYDGKIYTTGFADRNYNNVKYFFPCFIEDGHTIPSYLPEEDKNKISTLIEKTMAALDINFGVGKGDIVFTSDGPKVIEFAGRLSGGRFSTDTVPLATGVNIVKQVIKLSVGEKIDVNDLLPKYQLAAAQRYFFPEPGRVQQITGIELLDKLEWVKRLELYVKVGDIIKPITNHAERAGYVIVEGETRQEAIERVEWARQQVKIKTLRE